VFNKVPVTPLLGLSHFLHFVFLDALSASVGSGTLAGGKNPVHS
jgi:hypothetical protein